jgi:serine/threonine protein kinase
MGVIYEGVDDSLRMPVAIKVLSATIAADEENRQRFEREAQAAANLKHPNIAHVFYIGRTNDGLPFYAMEYIDGIGLDKIISKRMRTTGRQMLSIMQQTVKALGFSAVKGVMHRDVKPGNIMIAGDGVVKLVDFGLVKMSEKQANASLTQTGIALGTPNYLSPELAQGAPGDYRSDMYSAGCTFFEMVTGNLPYQGDTSMGVLLKQVSDPVPDIRAVNPQYPRRLATIIEKMMAKEPDDRYQNYEDIAVDLRRVLADEGEFVSSTWGYCPQCKHTTIVVGSNRCTVCNQEFASAPQPTDSLYTVRLMSVENKQARQRVQEYMCARTEKPVEHIQRMLQNMPVMLGTRVQYKQAVLLKMKLSELGAHVELERSGLRQEKRDGEAKTLALQMPVSDFMLKSSLPPSPPEPVPVMVGPRGWLIALGVLVLLTSLWITWLNYKGDPRIQELPADIAQEVLKAEGVALPGPSAMKPLDDDVITETEVVSVSIHVSSPLEYVFIDSVNYSSESELRELARLLEMDVSTVQVKLGELPVRRFNLVLNGNRKPNATDLLDVRGRVISGKLVIDAQDLIVSSRQLREAIWVKIGKSIIFHIAGARAPAWAEIGFALYIKSVLGGRALPSGDSTRVLEAQTIVNAEEIFLDVNDNPDTMIRAASFVQFLITTYSFKHFASWLSTADSPDPQPAFEKVYGQPMNSVFQTWQNQGG